MYPASDSAITSAAVSCLAASHIVQARAPARARRRPMPDTRPERDSMGEMQVPADAYYGASTQRAALNFPISGLRFSRPFIRVLGLVKLASGKVNEELGLLEPDISAAVQKAARAVVDRKSVV